MKPGRTANIRINPKDCMSCIDLVQKTGMNLKGASFSLIVSAALSSALESFRQHGLIPTRDGFEYTEMMQSYPAQNKSDRARALAITRVFAGVGSEGQVPAAVPASAEEKRKRVRFDELAFKANHDKANMDEAEQKELEGLIAELFPA